MLSREKIALADSLGPVVVDIEGTVLTTHEIERLRHPLTGAVILFTRNFANPDELTALTGAIHGVRPGILIAVDHEGGRVQRFREGFTAIPAMSDFRKFGDQAPGLLAAAGYVLASELRACGVDFSFTPVLDLDHGRSAVIGNRSLGATPAEVTRNARGLIAGLRQAGMSNCGKHFPGHGWAQADSHVALPTDERSLEEVLADLAQYRALTTELDSVMTAHVGYTCYGGETATYSRELLGHVLRESVGFSGIVFSDDLSMKGAGSLDSPAQRAIRALASGCDMVLHCNHPDEVDSILGELHWTRPAAFNERLARLLPDPGTPVSMQHLRQTALWRAAHGRLAEAGLV
ncbi:beta-N-acetylhexosaminidase [Sutterella sp.]|uniref:beta-N-acetylhexosaminidase n=1 Tax=Sutterella sp. TaxID=1981025 RepID=UPI0026E07D20|nr:beta-N-acetylhexosaminidase [Sutterella sp.]MDO5531101.1 beta-N-acetylhexosaminidase [Sutterella sp.]